MKGNGKSVSKMEPRLRDCNNDDRDGYNATPFDVDDFTKNSLPSIADIQNLLHFSENHPKKPMKVKRKCKSPSPTPSSMDSSTSSSESETEPEDEDGDQAMKRKRGKKTSGLYTQVGNSRIISNEIFAHAALEDEVGGDRELNSLSFNLFVVGELEIALDTNTSKTECNSRLKVLRMLAYKHEYLSREEVLNQYASFIRKVEKGKFKWGWDRDLQLFEQQLIYMISIKARKQDKTKFNKKVDKKWEDKKKYCLDFNRGGCTFDDSHKGKLAVQIMWKLHVCRKCLFKDGNELRHPEKECTRNK